MKFTTSFIAATAAIASVYSAPIRRAVNEALVPEFGLASGINPSGTGDCDGITNASGQPVLIPCACPPERSVFIQKLNENVAAGSVVNNPSVGISFPEDNSKESQLARINAALVTLQNLNGPGQGCPAASTTFVAQQKAIQDGTAAPVPSPAPAPAPAPVDNSGTDAPASGGVNEDLIPQFGLEAGLNPSGTGDCDGIIGASGQPVLIPCACPPERAVFVQKLNENVAAGSVVNNPTVGISFPEDNSKESQLARINAALVTLQNLNGPGVGCPAASTTFVAQQKAIQDGTAAPAPAAPAPAPAPVDTTPAAPAAGGVDPALVPEFGITPNTNPSGTGDCDGVVGPNGSPVLIPCACPPERGAFLEQLNANVAAGRAVNNPSVAVSFPTDDSTRSQSDRITAVLITLQNLNGPGQGCPAASTNLLAKQRELQAQL